MYRQKDFDKINDNIKDIENKALEFYIKNHNDPSIDEYKEVINLIRKIVIKNNLVVYGGYAQNELILKKNKTDGFYTEIDMPDYELYSPDPIKHSMEIVDAMFKKKYFNPKVDSALHEGTYKIFCNGINYSDITYIPLKIYKNLPTINLNGIKMIHPHFMMTDAYRVYSDLLTSNYRLSKTFFRMSKLFNYYPLDDNAEYNIIEYDFKEKENTINKLLELIRQRIIHNSKLIVIGHYAFNYYVKKTKLKKYEIKNIPYYQLISIDYDNDISYINKILNKKYSKKITKKEFYPFLSWWDKRTEFYYNDSVILKVYSNNKRCVPYRKSDAKLTLFGSFQTIIYYLFIDYNYALIKKNKESFIFLSMLVKMFKSRDSFLDEFDKTVLDNTPFEEFTYKCYGKPIDTLRESTINAIKRAQKGQKFKLFTYLPKGKKTKVPKFRYNDISGENIK